MELKKPILGICRGIQLLNVALGGTIYQDIPSQMERTFPLAHKQPFYYTVPSHHVDIKKGSLLSKASGGLERISYGTDQVIDQTAQTLTWEDNGQFYTLLGFYVEMTPEEFYQMADRKSVV